MEIALLAFFAVGYFVLAGADLGVGMLLPYLGRTPEERGRVLGSITPFFLTNEVWLVTAVGVLIGAFPVLEGEMLSGLYLPFVALLLGWVARDAGIWLRGRVDRAAWRAWCEGAVVAGSWLAVLSWGLILVGMGDGFTVGPGALVAAPLGAVLFAAHGLALAGLRLDGAPRERARRFAGPSAGRAVYALTSAGMALACLLAGARLPLAEHLADPATLALLTPSMVLLTPLLVASQVWLWWLFGRVQVRQ
ncbi:cytochrome d ubiquinol oxidase subunit II [Streptosporangium sp. NPDC006013]|uniref:cytochrome d ubiquinol oxidase subunit II n=1 Tax=Streptosporangium sp. NPDC006013 TaxID=3155596 RepID=UPI0033BE526C